MSLKKDGDRSNTSSTWGKYSCSIRSLKSYLSALLSPFYDFKLCFKLCVVWDKRLGTATFPVYGWLASLGWDSEGLGKPSLSMEESQWHRGPSCCHEVILWLLHFRQTAFITRLAGRRAFEILFAQQRSRTCIPLLFSMLEGSHWTCSDRMWFCTSRWRI